ncbi:hypothetical protein VTH06DRAFT_1394 [Thermothelomyces fergusii]
MFFLAQDSKLLGVGHVLLNILRAFNMIGLVAVMLTSLTMPILSGINHHFYFFDMATHVFIFLLAAFLFASELPVPWKGFKGYYERNWPVLGPDHSLAWLGWAMVFIGFQILGEAWKPAYTVETLGLAWWRAFLAASILSVTFGSFNICASVIFRTSIEGPRGDKVIVTSRQIRTHGKLAVQHAANRRADMEQSLLSHYSPPHRDNWPGWSWSKEEEAGEPPSGFRRLTRVLGPLNFNIGKSRSSRIHISKPILQQDPVVADDDPVRRSHSSHSSRHGADNDDRRSPVVPGLQRPPTLLHPAYTGGSRYTEYSAANMERF